VFSVLFTIVETAPVTVASIALVIAPAIEVAVLDAFNLITLDCVVAPAVDVQASVKFSDAAAAAFDIHISCTNGVA
jgi:hypothetical protein